ncbi:MAG: nucleotidyl transferase AbiEii/AbiGii toxin family protein [bacterium]
MTYMFHRLDRFSTDIDLDIIDINQESFIVQYMKELLIKFGDIKNETLGKNLHRWIFRYDEKSMNIKIELNKRIWTNNTYKLQKIDSIAIACMTPDCIFANKLVALSERFVNRDLYDVYFFFREKFPINEALITERT